MLALAIGTGSCFQPLERFVVPVATVVALSVSAGAQPADETGSEADAELKHVSIWTSPVPTPDNAFAAALMSAFQFSSYCQPVSLRPQFRTDITRYEAEFPGDVSLNVLAAAVSMCTACRWGNTLEIRVSGAGGDASRSWVFQLNRLAPDPNVEGDPECPDPAVNALMDAVSLMESGVAH